MDIQAAIDALPVKGGIVNIPVGEHPGPKLIMRDNVILQGSGNGTIIPPIGSTSPSPRRYGLALRDLVIDGDLPGGTPGYAIDWRDVTNSNISNVVTRNCTYGLILIRSYYNRIESLFASATVRAVELSDTANQNTFIGGKFNAPVGIRIIGCNGTTLMGVALESGNTDMVFKDISGDDGSTAALGVRQEDANHDSTYWNT